MRKDKVLMEEMIFQGQHVSVRVQPLSEIWVVFVAVLNTCMQLSMLLSLPVKSQEYPLSLLQMPLSLHPC